MVRATLGPSFFVNRSKLSAARTGLGSRLDVSGSGDMVLFTDRLSTGSGWAGIPEQRRRNFAPENAIVDQVLVEENAEVIEGTE